MSDITLMRVYEAEGDAPPTRGKVFLVDRLWPRGVRKDALHYDGWPKGATPSPDLRSWFHADPDARWEEFARRYRQELLQEADALQPMLDALSEGPITLLFAAKDTRHTHAKVLRDVLAELSGSGSAGG
ncbi:DUF488 domain-containing protein [Nocardiopsis coralliicola]